MNDRTGKFDISKALAMLSAFTSVGARSFDVTVTDIEGGKVEGKYRANRSFEELRRTIDRTLQEAERDRHNVIIRPRATTTTLIQLDDVDTEKAERIAPHAFLVIRTSGGQGTPSNHQAWVAVEKNAPPDFSRRLRKGAGEKPFAAGIDTVIFQNTVRILFFHHHPWLRRIGNYLTYLTDGDRLMGIIYGNVHLILFGHKHVRAAWTPQQVPGGGIRYGAAAAGSSRFEKDAIEIEITLDRRGPIVNMNPVPIWEPLGR